MWCVVCAGDDKTEVWGPYDNEELANEAKESLADAGDDSDDDDDADCDDNYEVVQMQQT